MTSPNSLWIGVVFVKSFKFYFYAHLVSQSGKLAVPFGCSQIFLGDLGGYTNTISK